MKNFIILFGLLVSLLSGHATASRTMPRPVPEDIKNYNPNCAELSELKKSWNYEPQPSPASAQILRMMRYIMFTLDFEPVENLPPLENKYPYKVRFMYEVLVPANGFMIEVELDDVWKEKIFGNIETAPNIFRGAIYMDMQKCRVVGGIGEYLDQRI